MTVNSENCILVEEAAKFPFALKLWLIINDETINCLRWNAEKTAIIIDLGSLGEAYVLKVFSIKTAADLLMILKYNGFERCSPESEANEPLDSTCVVYRHSSFVLSNEELFREWLLASHLPLADSNKNTSCGLHTGSFIKGFRPRITAHINLLDAHINLRETATVNKEDAFFDENLYTDKENSTSQAVDSFIVDPNSILGQSLAGITNAIAEFRDVYDSLDSELYATHIQDGPGGHDMHEETPRI